jgi:RNA polymerase sigma factor (sigma-70 family)
MLSVNRHQEQNHSEKPAKKVEADNEFLWELLRGGDQKAIEDLYRFNYQILYSYALKVCGDKELCKDCIQELFVSLWEKREKLGKVAKVRPYLLQSVWHLVIKKLKKNNKNVELNENDHYDIEIVFPNESFLINTQDKESKDNSLKKALDSLSIRQKQIIFMQYYEGLSIDEIKQITELKYQSIKNLTHRAMLALRAYYKQKKSSNI